MGFEKEEIKVDAPPPVEKQEEVVSLTVCPVKEEVCSVDKETNRNIENILRDICGNNGYTVSDYKTTKYDTRITFSSRFAAVVVNISDGRMTVRMRRYNTNEQVYSTEDNNLMRRVQNIFERKLQEQMTTYF